MFCLTPTVASRSTTFRPAPTSSPTGREAESCGASESRCRRSVRSSRTSGWRTAFCRGTIFATLRHRGDGMRTFQANPRWRDQRGIALPMALIALMVLSSLIIAFAVLSQSEPTIAANQSQVAVARAMAESGMERAIWALTAGSGVSGGLDAPNNLVTAAAPYKGATLFTTGLGGFTLQITG